MSDIEAREIVRDGRLPISKWDVGYLACTPVDNGLETRTEVCLFWVSCFDLETKSVLNFVISFPYTDTVKILEKWGPGCIFYGEDPDVNLSKFEAFLQESKDRGAIIAILVISSFVLIVVALRSYARYASVRGFGLDDWLALLALVSRMQYNIVTSILT